MAILVFVELYITSLFPLLRKKLLSSHLSPAEIQINEENQDNASIYDFEPSEEEILTDLLPRNLATQLFSSQIESTASELAARMTAMDNATRNAGEMIDKLTLQYNRTRQAVITSELIEIISGAEAL